ncbi:MAG: hypothetical protein IMZ69_00860, partial [Spirochaetes bacterium]|nr:hypothetical protein [Spirochaetota bacterium]
MAGAVQDLAHKTDLFLDFYDRNRIATWVRDHVGLVPWIRSRIGRSIQGWRSCGSWSHVPEGVDPLYLADDTGRIRTGEKDDGDGLTATDGIDRIRDLLRTPGNIVRLVGLSGVGKTRLVEALFDPCVGVNTLDPSLAFYTDISHGPIPQPAALALDLAAARRRAILVIDNCAPDVHRQLSDVVRSPSSTVSAITVEYDIREDEPEGTKVFALEPCSPTLIAKLVLQRFPALSEVDRNTIAEFAGGNARVALALAATVGKNETIAGVSDEDLFRRLFQQRHSADPGLLSIAEACSLVYSFDGETLSGELAELPILGALVGRSAQDVYVAVAELQRRHLVQQRGPWRAVLPQAIANRLAARALEDIPRAVVLSRFVENGLIRLLRSFSRRIGYLDDSRQAQEIVRDWLAPGGLLANVADLNDTGRAMFINVAPVAPEAALIAIERALRGTDDSTLKTCTYLIPLLRSLAYDSAYFERVVALLVMFGRLSKGERSAAQAVTVLESLFGVVLSGTHASVDLRLTVVQDLVGAMDEATRNLGLKALHAMLKTNGFIAPYSFEFGARSRDYGHHPRTQEEVREWFSTVLRFAGTFALSDGPAAESVRESIAQEFRGLWTNSGAPDDVERVSRAIATRQFWRDGWVAARETQAYDGEDLPTDLRERLLGLKEVLRPRNLVDTVRGVVLGSRSGRVGLEDFEDLGKLDYAAAAARADAIAERLGQDTVADDDTLG